MADKPKRSTKKTIYLDIVGSPKTLSPDVLPTKADVLRFYLYIKKNAFETIIDEVLNIWSQACVPTVSKSRVRQCLKKIHESYRSISRNYNAGKNDSKFKEKLTEFQKSQDVLFDIAACKCGDQCKCCAVIAVPELLRPFLKDQRSDRVMNMDMIRDSLLICQQTSKSAERLPKENSVNDSDSDGDCFLDDAADPDFVVRETVSRKSRMKYKHSTKYNTMNIDAVAMACDRFGISDTAGAVISTATLQSAGLVKEDNLQLVIDKNKVKRAREKIGQQLYSQRDDNIIGLYFDGRKDRTMYMEISEDDVPRKRFKKEEHISIIGEPFSKYLGHLSIDPPVNALNVSGDILNLFGNLDFSAMGCDGTVLNTGHSGGIIRLIEKELNRPLQWEICELHLNELPFKALFAFLDGDTSSPSDFKGPIGKTLSDSLNLQLEIFDPIPTNVTEFEGDIKTLSTDQLYLYEMCMAISSGVCSFRLSKRNPGAISNSRWLTVANHLLRTYVGTENPSDALVELVTYILNVYAPVWFNIKRNWKCTDGSLNLFKLIRDSRYLNKHNRKIVDESIQRNGFYAHHENVLLAMIRDKNKKIRSVAYQRILKCRTNQNKRTDSQVRKFVVPEIKFGAKNYQTMINWTQTQITEPPLTMKFSLQELRDLVDNGEKSAIWNSAEFSIPCHTQAVERCVKVVTECSAQVTSKRRDGIIRAKLKSRNIMPKFTSKSKYKLQKI